MARGKPLDEELKQQVITALLAGIGVAEASRRYHLPHATVSRLKSEIKPKLDEVGRESRLKLDDLLIDALSSNLTAQKRITDHCSKPEYLNRQNAEQVAKFFESIAKHSIQILEAANADEEDESETEP